RVAPAACLALTGLFPWRGPPDPWGFSPLARPRRCSARSRPLSAPACRCTTALGGAARPLLRLGLAPGRVLRRRGRLAALLLFLEASPPRWGPLPRRREKRRRPSPPALAAPP